MPESATVELPPEFVSHIFTTSEAARAAGIRSAQVKKERALAARINSLASQAESPVDNAAEQAINGQLKLVAEQIAHTRTVLNDSKFAWCPACERGGIEPHHRAQLLKALDSLLDRQRILLGLPLPGSLKPGSQRGGRRSWYDLPPPAPAPASVTVEPPKQLPAPTPACGLDTPTGSVSAHITPAPTPQDDVSVDGSDI